MNAYRRDFDKTKYMSFLIEDNELLEKYNEVCDKVSDIIKNGFDSDHVYNDKYLKTKTKSYGVKAITAFHNVKMPGEGSNSICLSVVLIDSVFKMG